MSPRTMTREMKADRGAGAGHLRWHHRDLHRGGAVHVGGGLDVTTAAYRTRIGYASLQLLRPSNR
jgi:hypothetical protein